MLRTVSSIRALVAVTSLSLLSGTFAAQAQAQTDPYGSIHYTKDSGLYRISGAPNSTPTLVPGAPAPAVRPTDLRYGGGHLYTTYEHVGTIPGTTGQYGDFYAWNEASGYRFKLTDFDGPRFYAPTSSSHTRWSNDRQDGFFSFYLQDTSVTPHVTHVVRARVSGAELALATPENPFAPLTAADLDPLNPGRRLEVVATWPRGMYHTWHPSGDSIVYLDDWTSQYKVRVHPVGSSPMDQDPILFDQAVTGIIPQQLDGASPEAPDQLVLKAATYSKRSTMGTDPSGLISLNLATGSWSWLIKDATKTGLDDCTSPTYSADGTGVAFTAVRLSNGRVVARGLYKVSTVDGAVHAIREVSANDSVGLLRRWTR